MTRSFRAGDAQRAQAATHSFKPGRKFMTQINRQMALGLMALAAGIANAGSAQSARAQAIADINAHIIATNIPGASAIAQVGTFLSGPATPFGQCSLPHPIPGFHSGDFIKTGAVLDPNRILVGSRSNFGAPLAPGVGQEGSFLSIDPSWPDILSVPPDFAGVGQASTLGGAVQMFSA